MTYKNRAQAAKIITLILTTVVVLMMLMACKPTPQEQVVTQKGTGELEEGIKQTASPTGQAEAVQEKFEYQKDYDSGRSLTVDATIIKNSTGIPVASIKEAPFKEGEQLKRITEVFCPDVTVYKRDNNFTKSELEEQILFYEHELYKWENDLIENKEGASYGLVEGVSNAESLVTQEDIIRANIQALKERYKTAPELTDFDESDYKFDEFNGDLQLGMSAEVDRQIVYLNFVNWLQYSGADFYFRHPDYIGPAPGENNNVYYFVHPTLLSEDEKFIDEKEKMDEFMEDMGIDYMSLSSVSKGELGYSFYYTRLVNGFHEIYTNNFISEIVHQTDGDDVFIDLWRPEYLYIETQNGKIVNAKWSNPAEITNIDNENVQIKPWEEIKEIFLKQLDYMLSANMTTLREDKGIVINRIELGLTKVIVKDSMGEYKLIPTWCFMGHEVSEDEKEIISSETCFLTINAIDGSIVNRGAMY